MTNGIELIEKAEQQAAEIIEQAKAAAQAIVDATAKQAAGLLDAAAEKSARIAAETETASVAELDLLRKQYGEKTEKGCEALRSNAQKGMDSAVERLVNEARN